MTVARSSSADVRSRSVVARSLRRGTAVGLALMLFAGAALVGIGGIIGVARADDRSVLGVASGAVWTVLLPAVFALLLAGRKPVLSLAVSAGAGVVVVARILSDLGVLTTTNTAIRPELFYELTDRAQPFGPAAGAAVVVIGDVVMLAAGVLAARRLSSGLSFRTAPIFDAGLLEPQINSSGAELLAEALESADAARAADLDLDDRTGSDRTGSDRTGFGGSGFAGSGFAATGFGGTGLDANGGVPQRDNWLISTGFIGVLGVLVASLGLPYEGGYLANRYLPPEIGLLGIAAALAVALVGTVALLTSAVLPRQVASALLGGVALGAAIPFVTAVAVRATGAPVRLNPTVGIGLLGAVVLVAAGLLARPRLVREGDDEPSPRSMRTLNIVGALLTLLVAAAGFGAWRMPQLSFNGGVVPTPVSGGDISAPQAAPFLVAAIIPLIGGLLWLVPGLRRAGRAISSLGWVAMIYTVAQSLYILGQLVNSASVPNAGFAAPRWTAGPGLWLGVVGVALGIAVLAVSAAASRQAVDSSASVVDEETLGQARSAGTLVAIVMTVATVVTVALPVYRTAQWASATALVGYQVNSWGVLAVAAAAISAAWMAARATSVSVAISFALAGAALLTVRLVIPAAVRAQDGFGVQAGLVSGYVAVAVFLLAAAVLAVITSRIRTVDPARAVRRPAVGQGASAAKAGRRSAAARPGRKPSEGKQSSGPKPAPPKPGPRRASGKGRR